MNRNTRLFFDASVLVSAAYSPYGGSARLVRLCELRLFVSLSSVLVLDETERALRQSFPPAALRHYETFLRTVLWIVLDVPHSQLLTRCMSIIHMDDAHVLASALEARADFLLTLDQKHFFTDAIRQASLPLIILTPGQFIQQHLPNHEEYPLSV